MSDTIDLESYFARIQWRGLRTPTFETLAGILNAHTRHIPFENLDVLFGRGVRLDLASLQNKLIRNHRGGYCFEHASLLGAVLDALGFQIARHAARVILVSPRDAAPRTHMFLTVVFDEKRYIVDPGFSAYSSPIPLLLDDRTETLTHRLVKEGAHWILHVRRDGQFQPGWITTCERENAIDFEVANHFVATSPASHFTKLLMLSARTPEGRVNVLNRDVTTIRNGEPQASQLTDRSSLRALLRAHFGFDEPAVERLRVTAIPEWT